MAALFYLPRLMILAIADRGHGARGDTVGSILLAGCC
jgi:uncharacterized membrane protein